MAATGESEIILTNDGFGRYRGRVSLDAHLWKDVVVMIGAKLEKTPVMDKEREPRQLELLQQIRNATERLGCHFCLEKFIDSIHESPLEKFNIAQDVDELDTTSVRALIESLSKVFKETRVFQNKQNPRVIHLVDGPLTVRRLDDEPPIEIAVTSRIGITQNADLPLRFTIAGNRFVSK